MRCYDDESVGATYFDLERALEETARLQMDNDRLRSALRDIFAELDEYGTKEGNPEHSHQTPGQWDGMNAMHLGDKCESCAMWNRAREALNHK